MPETFAMETPGGERPGSGRSWIAWMGAATILIALVVVMWPGSERRSARVRETHLPFGAPEQAYAAKLQIQDLALSRAENFLNQEVTGLSGQVINSGDRAIANVEITVEFADELGQIVLRESRTLFATPGPVLGPAEHKDFEISFEHIPSSWNIQKPAVRVSGILFLAGKE